MDELDELVKDISRNLKILEKKLKQQNVENVNIEYPRGVLRTAGYFRGRLSFINDETIRRNLAYHFLLTDMYKWILNRFDIALTAKEMLIKEGVCLYGNIIGAIILEVARKITPTKDKKGVQASITLLEKKKIINSDLKKDLKWLWGIRCKEHIEMLKEWEFQKYSLAQYNKAVAIWQNLETRLRNAKREGLI